MHTPHARTQAVDVSTFDLSMIDAARPTPAVLAPRGRRWDSHTLLGDEREVLIDHAGSIYRLRLTSLGKLILTK